MRIILATPEVDLRLAIQLLISEEPNVEIMGTASNAAGVLALIQTTPVDLVFLDWALSDCPMDILIGQIHDVQPNLDLIVMGSDPNLRRIPLPSPVHGILLKGEPPEKLLQVFRQVVANKKEIHYPKSDSTEEDAL